jgi:hypothetical protein
MNKRTSLAVIAAAGILGASVSGIALAANDNGAASACPKLTAAAEPFQRNAAGKTVGPYKLGGERPDFVPWNDGKVSGYVKLDEWVPPLDRSCRPVDRTQGAKPDANGDIKIPLYDFNGKRIGEAVVGHVEE